MSFQWKMKRKCLWCGWVVVFLIPLIMGTKKFEDIQIEDGLLVSLAPASSEESATEAVSAPVDVLGVDFKNLPTVSRVLVSATEKLEYDVVTDTDEMLVLKLKNAKIPSHLTRPLDTSSFPGMVKNVTLSALSGPPPAGDLKIELSQRTSYEISMEGPNLIVDFERPPDEKEEAVIPERRRFRPNWHWGA